MTINLISNAKKVIPNVTTSIRNIKARIIDGIEQGYDAQQVYENIEDEFYEGLSKEEQDHFGSFDIFLKEVNDQILKELISLVENDEIELPKANF